MAKPITQDPRYLPFVERYSANPVAFAREVQGVAISDQQEILLTAVGGSRSRVSVASGHSCFGKGTSIMLANGECVPVEDITVGDQLMGADGDSVRNVLSLSGGKDRLYKFTYHDKTSHVFNENHILCLIATNSKGRRVAGEKTTVTVKEWLAWGADKKRCHAIYRSPVKEFKREKEELPIPPYIMGVWLGDGTSSLAHVTTADSEIKEALQAYAESIGCDYKEKFNSVNSIVAMIIKTSGKINPMISKLRELGVYKNKHIPDVYLYASLEDRLELLAGLIDSDGCLDGFGYEFTQKDELMARQVMWLARSIGVHATIKGAVKTCTNNGVSGWYWRITIGRSADKIPVRTEKRKHRSVRTRRAGLNFGIKSVEPLGVGDYYGFELDGDRRFLGGDFTVLHNTGKTFSIGNLVYWHMVCHENSLTFLTANDMDQLKSTLWKEIAVAHERVRGGPHGWVADHVEILANASMRVIGFEKTWFVESKTANDKTANKMAGRHAEWLLIIADEAATISDNVMSTLNGALSEQHNRFLLTSQPIKNAGFFWRTHNEISTSQGGEWIALEFSSLHSPFMSDDSFMELWDTYDDDERNVRLLGRFPQDSSKHMMSLKVANALYDKGRIIRDDENYGWAVLCDIASGEGLRDKTAVAVARVIGYGDHGAEARRVEVVWIPLLTNNIRSNAVANYITEHGANLGNVTYVVDSGGLGINVCQDLEDTNHTVLRVNWGKPCWQKKNSERYLNLRAQASHQAAKAAKEGRLSILTNDHKRVLTSQASRIPKDWTGNGRIVVPPKGSPKWDGLGSPDLWDAVCFAFLENFQYIPDDAVADQSGMGIADVVAANAAGLFADLD